MPWRRLATPLLCLALALVAAPSSSADEALPERSMTEAITTAAATGDVLTVVQSDSVAAASFSATRVLCPAGWVAVGGGVDPFNVFLMEVTSSAPVFAQNNERLLFQPDGEQPAPNGWQVSIRNHDSAVQTYKAAVICTRDTTVNTIVGSATIAAGTFNGQSVTCPHEQVAVGGGVDLFNVLAMTVTSSGPSFGSQRLLLQPNGDHPAPNGWRAIARNDDATPRLLKVAVICSSAPSIRSVVTSGTAGANTFAVTRAACPPNMVALHGGLDPFNVLEMRLTTSAPFFAAGGGTRLLFQPDGEHGAPSEWWAGVRNYLSTAQSYKVAVICKPPVYTVDLPLIIR
ncbi:hypothetical protein [Kallotenue papyrolyticum]|uniref:hypothetical protein n=1 Tax=Kallotenue papyrolyticum TaxID=1325125 RepID=UPI0004BC6AE0|nr:hypothetical protein [Kallotenue papyrolyticum]